MSHANSYPQRGAASLSITLALLFATTLAALYANRNMVFEQRLSINQYRAAQASEAAEAGLEWAQAMINNPARIDADCQPSSDALDRSFREHHFHHDSATGAHTPITWNHAGHLVALQAACVFTSTGWTCSCPATGFPALSMPSADGAHPAFLIEFAPTAQAGVVRLIAKGCTHLSGICSPGSTSVPDASASAEVLLGLVHGLAAMPAAPLTAKASVHAGNAAIGLHNPNAESGGLTLHTGGAISAPNAHISTVAGGSPSASWAELDTTLDSLPTDRLFASIFGLDKATWQSQPVVTRLSCDANCAPALAVAANQGAAHAMLWIDGDAPIDGPVTLGTAERPVIVVVAGTLRLNGPVTIHGFIYAQRMVCNDNGSGPALLRGAVVSESDYQGNGEPDFVYDAAVLAALHSNSGSFARVPGSWRDF